ncbi:class I SAM-dependent methyltransferase [Massilia sp. SR12]
MAEWSAGYVADIGYTHGYYQELNPLRIKLAFLNAGLVCPDVGTACELGFGQGLSTNIHAAATLTRWYGTDFNPSQASLAREMAMHAGSGAELFDDAFSDFSMRSDLPDFDFICLHGIWSWISDENRHVIVDFVRRKLKVGGVLYLSYNSLPGWANFSPMRHLLATHFANQGGDGQGIVHQIDEALAFGKNFLALNPGYAQLNPTVQQRFEHVADQGRSYLAHEYFNRDWLPMHFATLAAWLEPAKVQFACSANYGAHFDHLNMSAEQQAFLQKIPDRMFRETVRDFIVNQSFRRDYWVKGIRTLSSLEVAEKMGEIMVALIKYRPDISYRIKLENSTAELNESIYRPLLDLLADHLPRTIMSIAQILAPHGVKFSQVIEALMLLSGAGHIVMAQAPEVAEERGQVAARLNDYIRGKARGGAEMNCVASPVTGGGVPLARFPALWSKAISEGINTVDGLANYVWAILKAQNQSLVIKGAQVTDPAESIAELKRGAQEFLEKQLPILRALKVV